MARYDYKCHNCGSIDERVHGMNETPEQTCDDCGAVMFKYFDSKSALTLARCGHNGELSPWEDFKMR